MSLDDMKGGLKPSLIPLTPPGPGVLPPLSVSSLTPPSSPASSSVAWGLLFPCSGKPAFPV